MTSDVTVLIPTLRADRWLDDAVRSVLSADAEVLVLVVFDGGAPDRDVDWFSDARVSALVLPERAGLATALNLGLEASSTEFVARMDSDDLCEPGRFARQRAFLASRPDCVLVSGAAYTMDERGQLTGQIGPPRRTPAEDIRKDLLARNWIIHPAVMFRRGPVLASGGYTSGLPFMEDYELWLRLALMGTVGMSSDLDIRYRQHPNQMTKAAPPWGPHIKAVMHARRRLAIKLQTRHGVQRTRDAAWLLAQALRYGRARVRRMTKA